MATMISPINFASTEIYFTFKQPASKFSIVERKTKCTMRDICLKSPPQYADLYVFYSNF